MEVLIAILIGGLGAVFIATCRPRSPARPPAKRQAPSESESAGPMPSRLAGPVEPREATVPSSRSRFRARQVEESRRDIRREIEQEAKQHMPLIEAHRDRIERELKSRGIIR